MIEVGGKRIYYVDFHCQWTYADCPALFIAGLSYFGFDAGLMVEPPTWEGIVDSVEKSGATFLPISGKEHHFTWGHIVSVGGEEEMVAGSSEPLEILAKMRSRSPLLIYAHPEGPPARQTLWETGKTLSLVQDGVIDAVEIVNANNYPHHKKVVEWYQKHFAEGVQIPITGGCDVHYLSAPSRPCIVYSKEFPPACPDSSKSDIDLLGGNRALVLAEECSVEAIIEAVKNCRTLVETFGNLLGPPDLVDYLLANGYWEVAARDLEERHKLALHTEHNLFSGRQSPPLTLCEPRENARVIFAGQTMNINGSDFTVELPDIGTKSEEWKGLTVQAADGLSLTSALQVSSPIEMDYYGCRDEKGLPIIKVELNNRSEIPLDGSLQISGDSEPPRTIDFSALPPKTKKTFSIEQNPSQPLSRARPIEITIKLAEKEIVKESRLVSYYGCFLADADALDWDNAEVIHADHQDLVAIGKWEGPTDASAHYRLLWSSKGLHFRVRVYDDIHYQPGTGNCLWQADSLQIGIDAWLMRGGNQAPLWDFGVGLAEGGAELYCYGVPTLLRSSADAKMPGHLPAENVNIEKLADGLLYTFLLPWHWLQPLDAKMGSRFGLFLVQFDHDGPQSEGSHGCKSFVYWPHTKKVSWKAGTAHWAVVTLLGEASGLVQKQM